MNQTAQNKGRFIKSLWVQLFQAQGHVQFIITNTISPWFEDHMVQTHLDVSMPLGEVHSPEGGLALPVLGVGGKDRPSALSLGTDDTTHFWKCKVLKISTQRGVVDQVGLYQIHRNISRCRFNCKLFGIFTKMKEGSEHTQHLKFPLILQHKIITIMAKQTCEIRFSTGWGKRK